MKSKNICKFPPNGPSFDLSVYCFVQETHRETMLSPQKLVHHRMILVEQGEGEFLFDDTKYSFSAGTLIFGFEGETFVLNKGEKVSFFYIDFHGIRANHLFRRVGIQPDTRKKNNYNSIIPFCKDCLLSTPQENIDMVAECVLMYVFSRMASNMPVRNNIIQRIIDITEESFHDPELTISSIAEKIGYNPKYLSHYFKKQMNINYSEYLRSVRFKYAISLFELGLSSVKNVAFLSGFSDPLYFSNTFKKAIGVSPKEFIANLSIDNE